MKKLFTVLLLSISVLLVFTACAGGGTVLKGGEPTVDFLVTNLGVNEQEAQEIREEIENVFKNINLTLNLSTSAKNKKNSLSRDLVEAGLYGGSVELGRYLLLEENAINFSYFKFTQPATFSEVEGTSNITLYLSDENLGIYNLVWAKEDIQKIKAESLCVKFTVDKDGYIKPFFDSSSVGGKLMLDTINESINNAEQKTLHFYLINNFEGNVDFDVDFGDPESTTRIEINKAQ